MERFIPSSTTSVQFPIQETQTQTLAPSDSKVSEVSRRAFTKTAGGGLEISTDAILHCITLPKEEALANLTALAQLMEAFNRLQANIKNSN